MLWSDSGKRGRRKKLDIKYIATDLSAAFISSVLENCPNAVQVFDHFHVVKLMNEKLDEIRRAQYNMERTSTSAKSFLFCGRELSFILIFKFRNRLSRLFLEKAH